MNLNLSKTNIIVIVFLIFLSIFLFWLLSDNKANNQEDEKNKIKLLNDYSRFFTLEKCVGNYVNYLAKKDSASLIQLIDYKYLTANNLDKTNLFTKIIELEQENYNFTARKIYYKQINDDLIEYYIYGHLSEDIMDTYSKPSDYYLIINFNPKTFIYSVVPYDGKIFEEES